MKKTENPIFPREKMVLDRKRKTIFFLSENRKKNFLESGRRVYQDVCFLLLFLVSP